MFGGMGGKIGSAWKGMGTPRSKSIALGLFAAATIPFAARMRRGGRGSNNTRTLPAPEPYDSSMGFGSMRSRRPTPGQLRTMLDDKGIKYR